MVSGAGIPIVDVPFVTVGGGIGSFVTVDYLRIAGVPTEQIRVLSALDHPWQTYEYLTRVSQIPRTERLRSDSASRPDNIWGFPSYAFGEGFKTPGSWWQVFVEPIFDDYYTPQAGQAFTAHGARGQPDPLQRHAGQGPGPDRPPTVRRRLLHDPHPARGRHRRPSGWRSAPGSCTWRSATRA